MIGLDEFIILGTRERTTLRQLAGNGRIMLRRSQSYRPAEADSPRKALWADVSQPNNPNAPEGFEISEAVYAELLAIGVPEEAPGGPTIRES
jgi:hypothetical protein